MSTDLQALSKEVASVGGKLDRLEENSIDLKETVTKFIEQYEFDMRGNKKINGEKGIVNEIRTFKKYIQENPSILWLLKNKTVRTILVISGIGLSIYFIGTLLFIAFGPTALIETFLKLLGIPTL